MEIYINGHQYQLKAGTTISHQPRSDWAQNIRTQGQRTRQDLTDYDTWIIDDWSGGFGTQRIRPNKDKDKISFWDSECNTLWPGQITPPLYQYTASIGQGSPGIGSIYAHPSMGLCLGTIVWPFKLMWNHGGELIGVGSFAIRPSYTGFTNLYPYKFSANTWQPVPSNSVGTITNTVFKVCAEALFGGEHCLLLAAPSQSPVSNSWWLAHTPTPGYYPVASTQGLTGTLSSHANMEGVMCQHADGLLYVAYWDEGKNTILDKFTTGYARTNVFILTTPYPPTGIASYYDTSDNAAIFLCFRNQLCRVDITNQLLIPVIDFSSESAQNANIGKNMRVWQGKLIIPTWRGIIAYNRDGTYESIGLDLDDGLPSDKTGNCSALAHSYEYLLQSLQATKSSIYALHEGGWHFITKSGLASVNIDPMILSAHNDGVQRLHFCAGSLPYFVEHPLENPLQYVPTARGTLSDITSLRGYITFPEYDGALPEKKAAFLSQFLEVGTATARYFIKSTYGINGASPTTTFELGQATSGNVELKFGAGVGTEGYFIQNKFEFHQDSIQESLAPVLRSVILNFLKQPDIRDVFTATIDIEATAKARQNMSAENILQEIGSLSSIKTQVPLHYGMIGTRLVLVREAPASEMGKHHPPLSEYDGERTGEVTLRLMEMLPH